MRAFTSALLVTIYFLSIGCEKPDSPDNISSASDQNSYVLVKGWPDLPEDMLLGNPTGLGIKSDQNLVVFHRADRNWTEPFPESTISDPTILTIDTSTGKLLNSWGSNLFIMPHGLEVDAMDNIWVTDVALHQIFKFSPEGELLMTLGEAGVYGDDEEHFYLPTDVAVAPDGSFYVSDGYGNSRVVKFDAEGTYLFEWGVLGNEKGSFNTPHGIDLDSDGNVYVADRENNRIQKFDEQGNFISLWQNTNTDQLYSVAVDTFRQKVFGIDYYLDDSQNPVGSDLFRFSPDLTSELQFGRSGDYDGPVTRYHDLAIDEEGNLYIGDILGNRLQKFERIPHYN